MKKIKEFKGSLKPIFNNNESDQLETEQNIILENKVLKDYLDINQIKPRDNQPRKVFDEVALEELSQSIKSKGVIQPIIVTPIDDRFYEIVVGERRWRAAKRVGLKEIPAIIKEYNDTDKIAVALIENIQRQNLNPLEEAYAIQSLLEECAMSHNQIAESIGKSRATVSNLLRLLNLENEVKILVNSGLLEMGHAKVLLGLSGEQQIKVAKLVVNKALSVRKTEELVKQFNNPKPKNHFNLDPEFEKKTMIWKSKLSKQISSKVNLHFNFDGKGKLVIHFDSVEEAEWLMDHVILTEL